MDNIRELFEAEVKRMKDNADQIPAWQPYIVSPNFVKHFGESPLWRAWERIPNTETLGRKISED